jgi:hypothetical protein
MRWSDVRNVLVTSAEWPRELEKAMATMESGQLPPPLTPFRSPAGIFIPVIVRAEIVDRVLRQVFLIFVPADSERLSPLFEGSSLPIAMPSALKSLVQLMRLMFRARWDILEPRRSEVVFKKPSEERCEEIVRVVLADYEQLNGDLAALGLSGDDAFHDIFHRDVWKEIDAYGEEWMALTSELSAKSPHKSDEVACLLTGLRNNNAKWMNIAATQFAQSIAKFCPAQESNAPKSHTT